MVFLGESLQQARKSPWALSLTEPVPERSELLPSDWPEKYFSGQSVRRTSRETLMSPYMKWYSSSDCRSCLAHAAGRFSWTVSEKKSTKPRRSQPVNIGTRKQMFVDNFLRQSDQRYCTFLKLMHEHMVIHDLHLQVNLLIICKYFLQTLLKTEL